MRLKRYSWTLIVLIFGGMMLSSCLNEENKIPPNCYDGELNNEETDVDCGGPNCPDCPPSCYNGIWDVFPELGWVEVDTDCGGPCPACPSCDDGVLNGDETGIDCGGPDCLPCSAEAGDCTNNIMDGDETGIDCGGCCCPDCPVGAGDCTNGVQDGDEEGVDCGGTSCAPCSQAAMQFTNPDDGVLDFPAASATYVGDALTIAGTDLDNGTISFTIPEPLPGWVDGLNVTFNEGTAPDQVCTYVIDGTSYTSNDPDASISMFIATIGTESGDIISGTFSGTLVDPLTGDTYEVNAGVFNVTVF